jgi:hypothetical protein
VNTVPKHSIRISPSLGIWILFPNIQSEYRRFRYMNTVPKHSIRISSSLGIWILFPNIRSEYPPFYVSFGLKAVISASFEIKFQPESSHTIFHNMTFTLHIKETRTCFKYIALIVFKIVTPLLPRIAHKIYTTLSLWVGGRRFRNERYWGYKPSTPAAIWNISGRERFVAKYVIDSEIIYRIWLDWTGCR